MQLRLIALVTLAACSGEGVGPGACVYDNDAGTYCKETVDSDNKSRIQDCVGDPVPVRIDDGVCADEGFTVACDSAGLFTVWVEDATLCDTL